ncbi:MAG TPA: FecR domain-containing protein [Planctomycetota bacterium]|nr:FecR domain-containing protein [Planctomycetota bacterium]
MSEHDYLLDPSAPPDAAVQALEQALAPLRWRDVPLREVPPHREAARTRRLWPWFLAAAVIAVAAGLWFARPEPALQPGAAPRTFVAGKGELHVALGELAELTLRPGSELRFVHWRPDQALFELVRGGLEARVVPPPKVQPGFFAIDTPLGRVVDQGCRFELELEGAARARVQVGEGAVTFVRDDRTVFVPAGAATMVTGAGVSTPLFTDASPALRKAVEEYDAMRTPKMSHDVRAKTLKLVSAAARARADSLVLWHVLQDPEPDFRAIAEAGLLSLVGDPEGGATKRSTWPPEEWLPFLRRKVWAKAN